MKTCYQHISFALFAFIFLLACETVVDLDIPFDRPKVTVSSSLVASESPEVRLTFSKHILDNNYNYAPIANATVRMIHNGNTYILEFDPEIGKYGNDAITIEAASLYQLIVEVPGYDAITVTETVPVSVPIQSFEINGIVELEWNTREDISLVFDDPIGENFYEIYAFNIQKYRYTNQSGEIVEYVNRQPIYLTAKNPVYQQEYGGFTILFNDRLFDGNTFEMEMFASGSPFTYDPGSGGVDLDVEVESYVVLKSVSRSYYLYQTTFNLQNWNDGDPFAQPVQVFTNIPNGLGIYSAQAPFVYQVR